MRLTAPDGYTAQRSYSVASAPDGTNELELTVERLEGGEVSTFLHDVVEPGDELEVRGPLGGLFVWDGATPALLVGGGSGVVPLMAMLRLARRTGPDRPRPPGRVRPQPRRPAATPPSCPGPETTVVYSRVAAAGVDRAAGPPDRRRPARSPLAPDTTAYVCGSAGFCNAAGDLLVGLGVPVERIRVERFGPTG